MFTAFYRYRFWSAVYDEMSPSSGPSLIHSTRRCQLVRITWVTGHRAAVMQSCLLCFIHALISIHDGCVIVDGYSRNERKKKAMMEKQDITETG